MARKGMAIVLGWALLLAGSASATDRGVTGQALLIETTKVVVLAKDAGITIVGADPVGGADSSITFDDGSAAATLALPARLWRTVETWPSLHT